MPTVHELVEEYKKLTPQERVAGYLAASAAHAVVGARLRTKYAAVHTDHHEGWNDAESKEFDAAADGIDAWWYAMSEEENKVARRCDGLFLAPLCRGEWPLPGEVPHVIVKEDGGKFEVAHQHAAGSAIVGRGATVLEAVGEYAIQHELLTIKTDPVELVDTKYRVHRSINAAKLVTEGCDRRD